MASTNLLDQYWQIKNQHKDALLFFRLGDFYELFDEDAVIASKALDIVLTKRQQTTPMCGVPVHSHEAYLQKLIRLGYKVAICEQVEKPSAVQKGPLKREVVRIVTPGTVTDEALLQQKDPNYLCVVSKSIKNEIGIAFCDLSSGYLILEDANHENLLSVLSSYNPKEIIVAQSVFSQFSIKGAAALSDSKFDVINAENYIKKYFSVAQSEVVGIKKNTHILATGVLIDYIYLTQKKDVCLIRKVLHAKDKNYLKIDQATWKNLELTETYGGASGSSFFNTINHTITACGHRLFLRRLQMPLIDKAEIHKRLDFIDYFFDKENAAEILKDFPDVERSLTRVCLFSKNLRKELCCIKKGIEIFERLKVFEAFKFCDLKNLLELFGSVFDQDQNIKTGFSQELDQQRGWQNCGHEIIRELEEKYKNDTGISNLKIRDNNIWGYFIEITQMHKSKVPDYFVHKQTLSTSSRYITSELLDAQNRIFAAAERVVEIESAILERLREAVLSHIDAIQKNCYLVANIDVAFSSARLAKKSNYCRPVIVDDPILDIKNGRHPVIETLVENFTPNDCALNDEQNFYMITGPNMGGKSTYMRQNALIIIMAQMGCFVPAESAIVGLFDRVMSRVGAADALSEGHSTFMVEMMETASILHQAGKKSFVIFDEIGRGTSTEDGLAIARAVSEYLLTDVFAKVLFATHYHELSELKNNCIRQKTIEIKEWENKIIFLHKIIDGVAKKSYGLHVAKLAGLPEKVLGLAEKFMHEIQPQKKPQLKLFESVFIESIIEEELKKIDLDDVSPKEAYAILEKWQKKLRKKDAC